MGFFAEFSIWLNNLLSTYIGDTTGRLSAALEPLVVTLGTLYVMAWGFLHATGKIEEPVLEGLKRIAILVVVWIALVIRQITTSLTRAAADLAGDSAQLTRAAAEISASSQSLAEAASAAGSEARLVRRLLAAPLQSTSAPG